MKNQISSELKKRAVAVAVASCLSLAPWAAQAAGLGKITVLSGLGQPLRAELEVSASREEMAGLAARLAPADAFKQAGVDYSSVLYDLRFALEKRPDGRQVVRISSSKPVNEPFLDFLVELNWPTGRLVREYTFLLDPPDVVVKPSGRPVAVVEAKTVQSLPGGTTALETAPAKPDVQSASKPVVTSASVAASKPMEPAAKSSESGDTRITKTGETLGKIAAETLHQGVSLEQMLVGLYQSNPDAFIGKNLNRLRAGAILNIPDKAAVEAIPEAEAKKVFHTQSGDWNAYRQKAASAAANAPVKDDSASQQAAGKITARVEEKPLPKEQTKDRVKVSRTDLSAKQAAANGMSEEEKIAKDKALKEANERVSILEKNVNELQKLVEMKNQKLAELQQLNASKPEELKPAVTPKEEPKPAEPVKPVEASKPVVEEPKPQEPAKPVEPPPPAVEPKPVPKPVALPPPPPELGFVESLLADPLTLAGGGGILSLLLGYALYKRRRVSAGPETTAVASSNAAEGAAFRGNGGQSVDTGNTPPQTGDFSQTGPGTIDTDEVDPVAEADVYMAYGRDAQAEEILLEALQKDPQRTAIHAKLLEIYANRQSLKQFETLASELYAQTAGVGAEWEKVAAMGARLDPANPLYSGASVQAPPVAPAFDAEATMVVSPAKAQAFAKDMSFELPAVDAEPAPVVEKAESGFASTIVQEAPPINVELSAQEETADDLAGLDFDLGAAIDTPPAADLDVPLQIDLPEPAPVLESIAEEIPADDALDFDLGMVSQAVEPAQPPSPAEVINFDIEIGEETKDLAPDFAPEGTLVMSNPQGMLADQIDEIELPVVSEAAPVDAMVDFELDMGLEDVAPFVEPLPVVEAPLESVPAIDSLPAENELAAMGEVDGDALEFDMQLTDSSVLGEQPSPSSFDISSINLDLAVNDAAELEQPAPEALSVAEADIELPVDAAPSSNAAVDEAAREEISTKLDLAKAYEEMGDLEGARELLSEVAAEGPLDLATEAKEILARIGS